MAKIHPYLTLEGNCEEAFNFYKEVFGGEFALVSRFNEMPPMPDAPPMDEATGNKIMHVSLPISENFVLMGSDNMPGMPATEGGTNFDISVAPESEEEAKKLFDALADGGNVLMPIEKQFWNAYYGKLKDKFGIGWMVNYTYPEE